MLNVEMQTYTYIGSTIVQIYYTILADIVRHTIGRAAAHKHEDASSNPARENDFFVVLCSVRLI